MRTFAAELREEKISTRTIDMNRMKRWMLMMAVLPRKALYDLISERVGFFANWQATKELSLWPHWGQAPLRPPHSMIHL